MKCNLGLSKLRELTENLNERDEKRKKDAEYYNELKQLLKPVTDKVDVLKTFNLRKVTNVLIISDDINDVKLIKKSFQFDPDFLKTKFNLFFTDTVKETFNFIKKQNPDMILVNCILSDEIILKLCGKNQKFPIILLGKPGSEEIAVKILEYGICDYVSKIDGDLPMKALAILERFHLKKSRRKINDLFFDVIDKYENLTS